MKIADVKRVAEILKKGGHYADAIDDRTLLVLGREEYIANLSSDRIYMFHLINEEEYARLRKATLPLNWRVEKSQDGKFALVFEEKWDKAEGQSNSRLAKNIAIALDDITEFEINRKEE